MSASETFGALLRSFRKRRGYSLVEVSEKAGISTSTLCNVERDRKTNRLPRLLVEKLATVLEVNPVERKQLLSAAGYDPNQSGLSSITEQIKGVLDIEPLSDIEREAFISQLRTFISHWERSRGVRDQPITKAVIAVAGWQARLLSPDRVQRMLLPAVAEAIAAGIHQIILVTAPKTPRPTVVEETFQIRVEQVFQDRARGLGDALYLCRESIGRHPFAVLLPDEVDDRQQSLKEMLEAYKISRTPMIAVDRDLITVKKPEVRYCGIAVLSHPVPKSLRLFTLKRSLLEKPANPETVDPESRKIVGRYILAPDIFDAISGSGVPRAETYELTDALNQSWQSVHAYKVRRRLISVAPIRAIIDKMDANELFEPRHYQKALGKRSH